MSLPSIPRALRETATTAGMDYVVASRDGLVIDSSLPHPDCDSCAAMVAVLLKSAEEALKRSGRRGEVDFVMVSAGDGVVTAAKAGDYYVALVHDGRHKGLALLILNRLRRALFRE